MTYKMKVELDLLDERAQQLAHRIPAASKIYAVPRGGLFALALLQKFKSVRIVFDPAEADFILDDLVDSGATKQKYACYAKPFLTLIDKQEKDSGLRGVWLEFPWETEEPAGGEDNVRRILQIVGEDPNREGLLETPARYIKAMKHYCKGYTENPAAILKVFEDGAAGYDQMLVRKGVKVLSLCEHHIAPITGTATVAYIPSGKIVGLSKIDRLVECFARRLQVQERLTCQIADALMEHLQPLGCGVIINATHGCMEHRGIHASDSTTMTSALRGAFMDDPTVRAEFMALAK
jgi:GTP cyclohydrolase I